MFSVLWDAVCSNVQVKVAVPAAPRAVLCASKHNPAGCCEGLPSSSSAACLQLGWPHWSCHSASNLCYVFICNAHLQPTLVTPEP